MRYYSNGVDFCLFVCLILLRPLNNLSVMRDGSSWVEHGVDVNKNAGSAVALWKSA